MFRQRLWCGHSGFESGLEHYYVEVVLIVGTGWVRVGVGLGWVMVMGNVGCTGLTIQGEMECVERWLDGWSSGHL